MGLPTDLARPLREASEQAPRGDVAVRIHLFGIMHAERLEGVNLRKLCAAAGISENWATEIHKGMRLSEHVTVR
ncbi:MAG: hypothetical protein ACHQ01_04640 [Candidatus Limnocylindrales bacterium]